MDMPSSLPFSKAFDFASGGTGERFQNPFWRFKEYLFGARLQRAVAEVKRFGDEVVTTAVRNREQSAPLPEKDNSDALRSNLIDSLLDHIEDRMVVRDAAMNYLSAGMLVHNISLPVAHTIDR